MIITTTPNEIILTIYNESSELSKHDFQTKCILNSILSEERDVLEDIKLALDQLSFKPKQRSVDAILNYSSTFMSSC